MWVAVKAANPVTLYCCLAPCGQTSTKPVVGPRQQNEYIHGRIQILWNNKIS